MNAKASMETFDRYREPLLRLRDLVPRLVDMLQIEGGVSSALWKNLDERLLPLVDPRLPLMVAICGGANAGKSTLFNTLLKTRLSPVRGQAGSTRRVLAAINPDIFNRRDFIDNLFDPFDSAPRPLQEPAELLTPGPPLVTTHPDVPPGLVLVDTPDFDTGSNDRFINREIAQEVLEACNVLIYIVTNTTYNNLENTRFMRQILTAAGMRRCILVYSCSRTLADSQVMSHLATTAANLYGDVKEEHLIGYYRTDTSDRVAAGDDFMRLRPARAGDPDIMNLLSGLDPREIRVRQIQTMLAAFARHVGQVVATAGIGRDEFELYAGALRLAVGRAVQQSLVSFPIKKIMLRMNDIWLETSPPHLKFLRGVGSAIGKPARVIFSVIKLARGDASEPAAGAGAVNPLEQIKSDLLGAASELRDTILAEEVIAEAGAKDPEALRLKGLIERIRTRRGLQSKEPPFRQTSAVTGTVTLHVAAPSGTHGIRQDVDRLPWSAVAERIATAARNILDTSEDVALNRELTALVEEFRQRMNFFQKTRESIFASLNVLPATLGIAYILTTGDPVGGSGIYAKLHGLFGVHDLWALVSIPASAGVDETGRRQLSEMLEPVVKKWVENRAGIVRQVLDETLSGEVIRAVRETAASADELIAEIEKDLRQFD